MKEFTYQLLISIGLSKTNQHSSRFHFAVLIKVHNAHNLKI